MWLTNQQFSGLRAASGARRLLVGTAMLLVLSAGARIISPPSAAAGSWMLLSCPSTSHASAASPGWSTLSGPNPGVHDGASTVCGGGQAMTAWLATLQPDYPGSSQTLQFKPPAGSTLAGGWLELSAIAAGHGAGAYAEVGVYAPALGGTPFWSCAYETCPQGTNNAYIGQLQIPPATGGNLYVSAACEGSANSSCQEGEDSLVWANAQLAEAHLLLANNALPHATGFAGTLLSGEARGTQELDLTATDPGGPGVYWIAAEIEGTTVYSGTPDTNGGTCVPSGATNAGVMMFITAQPCEQIEALKLPLETAGVPDAGHALTVRVTDAAQNTASVFVANITTHNAPVADTPPTILAPNGTSAAVTLSSTPGQWTAPAGAGTITEVYQWQQCSPTGTECQPIPGASAATYTPTSSDAGHTLKLTVTAVNNDGSQAAVSPATGVLAGQTAVLTSGEQPSGGAAGSSGEPGAPNGSGASTDAAISLSLHGRVSRPFARRAITITGKLLSTDGQPISGAVVEVLCQTPDASKMTAIGHATTSTAGAFAARIPPGPSRVIELAYRAFANNSTYAAEAKVSESVSAGATLHATPRHPGSSGTVTLTGRVLGAVPPSGVNLALEVFYRGQWVVMNASHTLSDGRFTLRYQFQHAAGKFPFRVKTLGGQRAFPYDAGYSQTISVIVR
ncbi:MAG TPA: hypothetical protein VID48_01320 [Solirubrobacteraceae bacterium]